MYITAAVFLYLLFMQEFNEWSDHAPVVSNIKYTGCDPKINNAPCEVKPSVSYKWKRVAGSVTYTFDVSCTRYHCSSNESYCNCDEVCHVFDDCCEDVFNETLYLDLLLDQNKTIIFLEDKLDAKNVPISHLLDYGKCQEVHKNRSSGFYRMVSVCPSAYNDSIMVRDLCENLSAKDPRNIAVSYVGNEANQVVYRNMYCAYCHGLGTEDVSPWVAYIVCQPYISFPITYSELIHYLSDDSCYLIQDPPGSMENPRKCVDESNLISECTRNDSSHLCKGYLSPVETNRGRFRNKDCAQCSMALEKSEVYDEICPPLNHSYLNNGTFNSFSNQQPLILTKHTLTWGTEVRNLSLFCADEEVYKVSLQNCRETNCVKDYYENTGECHFDADAHVLDDRETVPKYLNESIKSKLRMSLIFVDVHGAKEDLTRSFIEVIGVYIKTLLSVDSHVGSVTITCEMPDNLTFLLDGLFNFVQVHSYKHDINVSIENFNTSDSLYCRDRDYIRYDSTNINIVKVQKYNQYIFGEIPDARVFVRVDVSRFVLHISKQYISLKQFAFCFYHICREYIAYNTSQFIFHEGLISVDGKTLKATHAEHKLLGNVLYLCEETRLTIIPLAGDAQRILSTVCLMVSVISLLALVFFHVFFKSLRNLNGKILVSFSLSLIITNILFMTQNLVSDSTCDYFAVFQHYMWLSTFQWSCIMAYDLTRMTRKRSPVTTLNNDKTRLFIYFSIALITPLPLVVVCCLLDFHYITSSIKVEYGRTDNDMGMCWMHNHDGNLIFFAAPLSFAMLFNIVCFFITLYEIEKVKRKTKFLRKNKFEENRCKIYAKITILLGATWLVSFIASYSRNTVVLYANILMNGLQGTFIFIGFLQGSKVMHIIKSIFCFDKKKLYHDTELHPNASPNCLSTISNETKL